jgi:hypothetical protein
MFSPTTLKAVVRRTGAWQLPPNGADRHRHSQGTGTYAHPFCGAETAWACGTWGTLEAQCFWASDALADQAGALPNSLSPITAEDGPVMVHLRLTNGTLSVR